MPRMAPESAATDHIQNLPTMMARSSVSKLTVPGGSGVRAGLARPVPELKIAVPALPALLFRVELHNSGWLSRSDCSPGESRGWNQGALDPVTGSVAPLDAHEGAAMQQLPQTPCARVRTDYQGRRTATRP